MRLPDGAITSLAERGKCSLQVPDLYFHEESLVEYPDEWFVQLKYDGGLRPVVGREQGCLHLSRIGYEANKDAIKNAFLRSGPVDWSDFERHAEMHFRTLRTTTEKLVARLTKQLSAAQETLKTL